MKKIFSKKVFIVLAVVLVLLLAFFGYIVLASSGLIDQTYNQFHAKLDIDLDRNTEALKMRQPLFGSDLIKVINSTNELCEYSIISKYDDEYFVNNALVIVSVTKGSGSIEVVPTTLKIKNNQMTIKYESYSPGSGTCDMAYWYIFVECSKEEAANLDKIVVYEGLKKVGELTK